MSAPELELEPELGGEIKSLTFFLKKENYNSKLKIQNSFFT